MSAVMKLIDLNAITEADDWHSKVHKSNLKKMASNPGADNTPDTVLGKAYIDYADDATKMVLVSGPMRDILKFECTKLHISGKTYCYIYTYAHWRVQQKFGVDVAGREYDIRGVFNNPEIRDYFQQVVKEVVERAKAIS